MHGPCDKPFQLAHAVTFTFDLFQGQISCRAGDHNSPNLVVKDSGSAPDWQWSGTTVCYWYKRLRAAVGARVAPPYEGITGVNHSLHSLYPRIPIDISQPYYVRVEDALLKLITEVCQN